MKEHLKTFGIAALAVVVGLLAYNYVIVPLVNNMSVAAPTAVATATK